MLSTHRIGGTEYIVFLNVVYIYMVYVVDSLRVTTSDTSTEAIR